MSIKELRKMSQENFAKKADVPVEAIKHWEAGKYTPNEFEISILSTLLNYTQDTTKDMCLLGLRLSDLKKSDCWKSSLNPNTKSIIKYTSFQSYCESVFGFSHTRTSNLLKMTLFVKANGDNIEFIDPMYEKYNTSQLIELATINQELHQYFNSTMSCQDIRNAKRYIKYGSFFQDKINPHFNLLQYTNSWLNK